MRLPTADRFGRSCLSVSLLAVVSLGLMLVQPASADHHNESVSTTAKEIAEDVALSDGEGEGFDAEHDADAHGAVDGTSHEAAHDGEHDGHGEQGPLAAKVDLGIYSLVVFLGFLALLTKFCWKPLMDGLNQRETNIRGAVQSAEAARDEAAALLAEHKTRMAGVDDEVKEIIAEARRDAETTKADIIAAANSEAESARDRGLADIERARQQALADLANRERDLVVSATEQVLGRTIDENDRQRLIDDALNQFASRN